MYTINQLLKKAKPICFGALIASSFTFTSCSKEEKTEVISKSIEQHASEITFRVSLEFRPTFAYDYVLTEQLKSVSIKINGIDWGSYDSEMIDLSDYDSHQDNNVDLSYDRVYYYFKIPATKTASELSKNPELEDLLNSSNALYPGKYNLSIHSVSIDDITNNTQTDKYYDASNTVDIQQNQYTVYAGDYNLGFEL